MPQNLLHWLGPIDELLQRDLYYEAELMLNQLVKDGNAVADAHALLAALKLWTQREFEAINHLVNASFGRDYEWVLNLAIRFFTARQQMASKKKITDAQGQSALNQISTLPGYSPISENLIGVTACLIVKNESENLERCLKSLSGIADEIVVIDTGSTDNTLEIAESMGCKCGTFAWCNDFSVARNASIELATQPWILWIDADEELKNGSQPMLEEAFMRPQFGGYQVQIVNFTDSKNPAQQFVHTPLRLFVRHKDVRFTGKIHEQIVSGILDLGLKTATLNGVTINHYGYTAEMMADRNKIERTISMLEKEIEENPDFSFTWFNLANTYAVARDFKKAAEAAQKCIDTLPSKATYGETAYDVLAASLLELGRIDECLHAVAAAEDCGLHTILTEFDRLNAYLRSGQNQLALASGSKCMEMEWKPGLTGDFGVASFKRHIQYARALAQNNQLDEALALVNQSLEINNLNPGAWGIKGAILIKQGAFHDALDSLQNCFPADFFAQTCSFDLTTIQLEAIPMVVEAALATSNFGLADRILALDFNFEKYLDSWIRCLKSKQLPEGLAILEAHFSRPNSRHKIASAYLESNLPKEAINSISPILKLVPEDPIGWFITGDANFQLEQFIDAAENYQHGLTLEPCNAQGWFVLANSMAKLGANAAAFGLYKQCLTLDPSHEKARFNQKIVSELNIAS